MQYYTTKFHKVEFYSKDKIKFKELFMGDTPSESLKKAKQEKRGYVRFRALKTTYIL